MGVTIRGDWKNAPEWELGYASFFRLRRDIAYYVSEEFGNHYAALIHLNHFNDDGSYDKTTEYLINKYHCKSRIIDFLYSTDCGYRLSPFKCKAVYDLIEKGGDYCDKNTLYGYAETPERCIKLQEFIDLLYECYKRRKALIWC